MTAETEKTGKPNRVPTPGSANIPLDLNRVIKRFTLIFAALALAATGMAVLLYHSDTKTYRNATRLSQRQAVKLAVEDISLQLRSVRSDLLYLANQAELDDWLSHTGPHVRGKLARDYLVFDAQKHIYDQIRLIDPTGRELVRVNWNGGHPKIVADADLQDKAERYYVRAALSLGHNGIYISPFDLNVEHGKIEQPAKPIIRFATPVFDKADRLRGVIVVNYVGETLLRDMANIDSQLPGGLWLINARGFWLRGPDPDREWGFMYPQHGNETIDHAYPGAWTQINRGDAEGQFMAGGDLFAFRTVSPVTSIESMGLEKPIDVKFGGGGPWYVVARIPASILSAESTSIRQNFQFGYAALLIVLAAISWAIAHLGVRRRQAEETTLAARTQYEDLVNSLNVGVFRVLPDPDSPLLELNPALVRIFRAPSREALLSIPRKKLYADEEYCQVSTERLLDTGAKSDEEIEFRRLNGERFWASITAVKRTDAAGKVYFNGVLTDITVRKQTEEALRDSEALFRRLLESAPDGVIIVDDQGRIVLISSQGEKMFGYASGELMGMPVEVLVPQNLRSAHTRHRAAYFQSPHTRAMGVGLELFGIRKDGTRFPVEISLSPIASKQGPLVMSVVRDVTERNATEGRFRAVAENANDSVISIDSRGNIIYFNRAAEQAFGYDAAEVLDRPLTLLIPERYRDAHEHGLQRYLATQEAKVIGSSMELDGKRKDGTEFPVEVSLASWRMRDETYFTGILRDITLRKENEKRIIDLNSRLLERTNELETVNKELEAFSYSVSHDLRGPLRAIDGFSQVLAEDYRDKLDESGLDYLQRVRKGAQHMGNLIDDLLKLSRVTRAELKLVTVNLSDLVQSIAEELRDLDPQRQVEISITPGLLTSGDPRLLQVALKNLMDNAWKFTSKQTQARIEFGVEENEQGLIYYLRDNGVGFDPRYAHKLFSAFQRLHDASEFPGTGIGLATVKRVITKHGGQIWVEGAPGEGTTFYFTLHPKYAVRDAADVSAPGENA